MSISQFGASGEKPIPAGWALPPDRELSLNSRNAVGNDIITAELQKIDHDIETLLELRASLTGYGLAKIAPASLTDATQESDLACGAFEKNAGIPGTLANGIEQNRENSRNKFYIYQKHLQMSDFEPRGVFVASYWDSGYKEDNFQNLTDTMPAPFNDKNNVVVICASTENHEFWGSPSPVTTWSKSSVTVFKPDVDWNNLYLSIALMRTNI